MALPQSFLDHLNSEGYHPRSNRHSNALAEAIVSDLVANCLAIAADMRRGALVYDLNFDLGGRSNWNVDLVIGQPPPTGESPSSIAVQRRAPPSTVRIAVELKAVMTAHRKAVKNRARDLEAHHTHVHAYDRRAIAAGLLVVNAAGRFRSPLRGEPTVHRNVDSLARHCVDEIRAVEVRGPSHEAGIDAKAVLIVDYDNMGGTATYVDGRSAPRVGDPIHYDAFIQRICSEYEVRWSR